MAELTYRDAVARGIAQEMTRDPDVIFFGEDVAKPGGVFAVTPGLQERHGADRVFDTPISELALSGAAFGAAVNGLRPVIEIMFGDFLPIAMDAIVNQAAKYRKPGELDVWKARDQLIVAAAALRERFGVAAEDIAALDRDVDRELEQAAERALASPYPEPDGSYAEFSA